MSKPRFAPFVHLTIERNGDLVSVTLSQDSALPDQRLHIEYANMEGLALRKVAHAAVAARITDKWAPSADELLERMTEADRVKLAPHLRQSAQDIAEMMAATVGRIDALMAPPVAGGQ